MFSDLLLKGVPRRLTLSRQNNNASDHNNNNTTSTENNSDNNDELDVVNYVAFNQDHSYVAVATNRGVCISQCAKGALIPKIRRNVKGGLSIVQLLEQSNVLVYVGTGTNPNLPDNKLVIWDEQ